MKKILILGIGQSNFLNQLYSSIYDIDESFLFSIDGYREISRKSANLNHLPYKNYFSFRTHPISKWVLYKNLILLFTKRFFWQVLLFEISIGKSLKNIKKIFFSFARARIRVKKYINPLDIDIVHFHFCSPKNLREIFFLSSKTRIICSFWGSDLMRLTGVSNVFYVGKALEKADELTIQTPEMGQILCSKYGRKFSQKLNILRFVLDNKIFKEIEKYRNQKDHIFEFKKIIGIPTDKIVVAIGHNAAPENNHINIIQKLYYIPKEIRDKTVFILHVSYGSSMDYIASLCRIAEEDRDLDLHIIKDYLQAREIALLRLSTDILIQLPISDALSAAMTEVIYAGNSVITGAWLPYGILKRNGIQFNEIEDFNELTESLEDLLRFPDRYKSQAQTNISSIEDLLLSEKNLTRWVDLFNKVWQREKELKLQN